MLGKSAKPIPVLILGIIFARKRYPAGKFLYVLLIVIGVAMFLFKDDKAGGSVGVSFGIGEILLVSARCNLSFYPSTFRKWIINSE